MGSIQVLSRPGASAWWCCGRFAGDGAKAWVELG